MSLEHRIAATEQADSILLKYPDLPATDASYLRTVLTEAILFEVPIRQLRVAITDTADTYTIVIQGYMSALNDLTWANTFYGKNRHQHLQSVVDVRTLFPDQAKILQMKKMHFVTASEPAPAASHSKRNFSKRTH